MNRHHVRRQFSSPICLFVAVLGALWAGEATAICNAYSLYYVKTGYQTVGNCTWTLFAAYYCNSGLPTNSTTGAGCCGGYCLPYPVNTCEDECPAPALSGMQPTKRCIGNPFTASGGASYIQSTDVDIPGSVGGIEFSRTFSSTPGHWSDDLPFSKAPSPFGASPVSEWTPQWWHSALAVITVRSDYWSVRDRGGDLLRFAPCGASSCWAVPLAGNTSIPERLQKVSSSKFVLWRGNGEQLVFEGKFVKANSADRYFLTEVKSPSGQSALQVAYGQPTQSDGGALTCPTGDTGTTPAAVPYVGELRSLETTLRFYYEQRARLDGGPSECVMASSAIVSPAGGAPTEVSTYQYTPGQSGLVSQAVFRGRTESYDYALSDGGKGFARWQAALPAPSKLLLTAHNMESGLVTADTWSNDYSTGNLNVTWSTEPCTNCCGATASKATVYDPDAPRGDNAFGDGKPATAGYVRKYLTVDNNGQEHSPRVLETEDECIFPEFCSPGTTRTEWSCSSTDGGTDVGYELGTRNKRGYWATNTWALVDGGVRGQVLERRSASIGAASATTNGLQTTNYSYTYGANDQQLPSTTSTVSVIAPPAQAVTQRWYDSNNRVYKVTRTGYTRDLAGSTVAKTIGVFFNTTRSTACGLTQTSDAFGRTLEVQGPCAMASASATECLTTNYPLTMYEYWPDNEPSHNRNRLKSVTRSGNGATCSIPLTIQLSNYDALGNPGRVIDENGVQADYEYDSGSHITKKTVDSGNAGVTRYSYLNNKLITVRHPEGNGELFCHFTGGSACSVGSAKPTNLLQWRAKVACVGAPSYACGSTWSEAISYSYAADGTLARAEYRSCPNGDFCTTGTDGVIRKVEVFASDVHKRPTIDGLGTGDGGLGAVTYANHRMFNRSDLVAGVGHAFVGAPVFCEGPQDAGADEPKSKLCTALRYDEADRLKEVDAFPDQPGDTTNSMRTCVEHDSNGNMRKVEPGGAGGIACVGGSTGQSSDYLYDDFGDIVEIAQPFMSGTDGGKGVTRQEFDALGQVLKRQTPEMQAQTPSVNLRYSYDTLGRILEARREGGGTADVLLYRLTYDNMTTDSPCLTLSNGKGRLTLREDSFGHTWYDYDKNGRTTKEVRRRGASCGVPHDNASPDTYYSYDLNGNITQIEYPRGRTVSFEYDQTNGANRRVAIKYKNWNGSGSGWSPTFSNAIDNIRWEPYGGLRAYRIVSSNQWVEYYLGGELEDTPTTSTQCDLLPATYAGADGTGRVRGLFVSDGTSAVIGSPNGSFFKQVYKWKADMVVGQYTCHRNGLQGGGNGVIAVDTYGYDNTLRTTSATTNVAASAGETFQYDRRGNRTWLGLTGPSCQTASDFVYNKADQQAGVQWGGVGQPCNNSALGRYNYAYDKDGRRTSTTYVSGEYQVSHSYSQGSAWAGTESVIKNATIMGGSYVAGTYGYLYDAFNRRRAKTTPWSSEDEYFYDLGHQLLSDKGGDVVGASSTAYPEDDYIWLDGRPVVIIRSKFDLSWVRAAEGVYSCPRNGVGNVCSVNFPVTDLIGRPVAMFSTNTHVTGGTAGSARYQTFGAANRRDARYATPHYTANSGTILTIDEYMPPGFDGTARVLFNKTDYLSRFGTMTFNGVTQPLGGQIGGAPQTRAHVWTSSEYRTSTGWVLSWTATGSPYGFDVEGYELMLKQWWVYQFWTPLRSPGQYYDEETELHENWNRYYDPQTGRYLQPEPLLQSPHFALATARRGMSMPTYAYAANNPVAFYDPDGYWVRSVAQGLKPYTTAMQQTPTGRLLWERMQASPNAIDLSIGKTKPEKGKKKGPRGQTTKAASNGQLCGGDINITIDLDRKGDDWDILSTVGHESVHAVQLEETHMDGVTEKDYSGVLEPKAGELGFDVAREYFGGYVVTP